MDCSLWINAAPWTSNPVVFKKKSGGLLVYVDLSGLLTKAVIPDKLPPAEELATRFYGTATLSKLGLHQGYLQVPLHADG